MQSAVHRIECPIADPAEQLPVPPKAPAQPPGTLGPLPPIIHPTGSSHSDPLPMVSQGLQVADPYNTQETQSDVQGYGLTVLPFLNKSTLGPRARAEAQEELQKLEELERNRKSSECGEVVEAAEHQDVNVQTKDVILRTTARNLKALVRGGAGEAVLADTLVQQLLDRSGQKQGQGEAPTDSASRPPEPACGSSEAAPTAAVDPGSRSPGGPSPGSRSPSRPSERARRSRSPGSSGPRTSLADALGMPMLSQLTVSNCSESTGRVIVMETLQTVMQFAQEESTPAADASTQHHEPASGGSEPAGGGSELPAAAPGSALGSLSPEHEALPTIREEDHVGEPGQGCS